MLSSKEIWNVCIIGLLGYVIATVAISPDVNEIKNSIVSNLPEGITLPDLDGINFEEVYQKLTEVIKKKCNDASGGDVAYDQLTESATSFSECIQNLADFSNLEDEIEKAKPTGDLDLVFNKYCGRRHEALNCLDKFSNSTNACLTDEEKTHKKTVTGIIRRLLEFVCHENGNQIALFIAEEGPQCFSSKRDQLVSCFNQTYSKYYTTEMPSLENIPKFTISRENCLDLKTFEDCVVNELEKCRESTPANLVEALFRYIKRETPCKNVK